MLWYVCGGIVALWILLALLRYAFDRLKDRRQDQHRRDEHLQYLQRSNDGLREELRQKSQEMEDQRVRMLRAREEAEARVSVEWAEARKEREQAQVMDRLCREKTIGFPWLAKAYADYYHLLDLQVADRLENKLHPAQKAAEAVREQAGRRRAAEEAYRVLKYQIEYYESLFPWLVEFKGEDVDELIVQMVGREETGKGVDEGPDDPARQWLAQAEWDKLPTRDKFQKALDRYWQNRKSKWQIGRDYERYVGYLYEKDGYAVHYHGIVEGFDDLGRDLICTSRGKVDIVQCKQWSREKTIHEKHIFQLYGSLVAYRVDHPQANASAHFITTTRLSERASLFAQTLGIAVDQEFAFKPYPCIKCNISRSNGDRIYHLPFDQQYDTTIIEPERGECYVATVAEAEDRGYRRAYRWRGESEMDS